MDGPTTLAQPWRPTRSSVLHRVLTFVGEHPVWGVFPLALAIRLGVAIAIAIVHPQNIAPDGVEYSALAAAKAGGHSDTRAGMALNAQSAIPRMRGADLSYLPQGVFVMLAQPYPWQVTAAHT